MQGSGKLITALSVVVLFLLLYVHAHISLFRVSYEISDKSRELANKNEQYRYLKYEVDQMKAPHLLETKMEQLKLDLTLPHEVRVIRLPQVTAVETEAVDRISLQPLSDTLLDFVGRWVKVAQAKTET